jgi:hypothetical protein
LVYSFISCLHLCFNLTLLLHITDEIHCVKSLAIDETSVLIERSLHELQIEIDSKIPDLRKSAYLQSQLTVKGRSFVNSKEFRLRFLRFELFDIQRSGIRMLKWLELALSIFGSVALERPICMSDFSSHEQKIFRKGYIQVLPVRAFGTGRRIICISPYDEDWYTISKQLILKIVMYTFWIIGNDIDTQRKGVVLILMFDSSFSQIRKGVILPSDQWLLCVRMSAIHVCSPDTPYYRLRRSLVTMAIGSENRSRLKLHLGTSVELRYKLQVYGIPIECIPLTYTGKIKLSHIRQWIRLRNMIEDQEELIAADSNSNTNITNNDNIVVEAPYLNDVLFKQGNSFTSHPGNNTLRTLIESKVKQFVGIENCNPHQAVIKLSRRKELLQEIMVEIEDKHHGRFLYWHKSNDMTDHWWVLLHSNGNTNDQKVTLNKIEPLFRKMHAKIKQQYQLQQKLINTKRITMQQELIHQKMDTGQNNSDQGNEKTKIESIINDSLSIIDPPAITTASSTTTINQNGRTLSSHALADGKHNTNHGLLSFHQIEDDDTNRTMTMTTASSSLSCIPSSECFGMKFVPFSDQNI